MRAQRVLARLAAAGAMIAAVAAGVVVNPGVAAAAPEPYPPTGPSLTVSSASVGVGHSVIIRGSHYGASEIVAVRVRYRFQLRPGWHGPSIAVGAGAARTDPQGRFEKRVGLWLPGYATITATGLRSGKSASVTVRVLAWRNSWSNQFHGMSDRLVPFDFETPGHKAVGARHFKLTSNVVAGPQQEQPR